MNVPIPTTNRTDALTVNINAHRKEISTSTWCGLIVSRITLSLWNKKGCAFIVGVYHLNIFFFSSNRLSEPHNQKRQLNKHRNCATINYITINDICWANFSWRQNSHLSSENLLRGENSTTGNSSMHRWVCIQIWLWFLTLWRQNRNAHEFSVELLTVWLKI